MIKAKNQLQGQLNASIIHEYPELENVEITPAVEDKVYKSDMYGFDEVLVKGVQAYIDEDIKPEYIKEGIDILGVVGNVVELKGEEKVITPKTIAQTIVPSENKNAMTKITVQPVDNTIDTNITPENIVDGVEILGVIGNYKGIDTSDATVSPSDVLEGKTVYINNQKIVGTLPNNGELEFEPSDEEQEVPEGYTSGGYIKSADITKLNEYDKCLMIANSIEDMSDYSDTTATPEDIVKGKTAYSNGERITGTLETVNTSLFTGCGYLFRDSLFTEAPLFDTSNVKNMTSMFQNCPNLVTIPTYNTSNVTNVYRMFYGCSSLKSIPKIDTSKVTGMGGFLMNCTNLVDFPILDTSSVVWTGTGTLATRQIFEGCEKLSDTSLNNILAFCTSMKGVTKDKTLAYIGLTKSQATKCQSLSNYQAFIEAGWTTGY